MQWLLLLHCLVLRAAGKACLLQDLACLLVDVHSLSVLLLLPPGTVEFMVDKHGDRFFLEVNPRVQVGANKQISTWD